MKTAFYANSVCLLLLTNIQSCRFSVLLPVWVQVCRSAEGYLMPTAYLANFLHSWGLDYRSTESKERITLKSLWKNYQLQGGHSAPISKFSASNFDIHIDCWKDLYYIYKYTGILHLLFSYHPQVYKLNSLYYSELWY